MSDELHIYIAKSETGVLRICPSNPKFYEKGQEFYPHITNAQAIIPLEERERIPVGVTEYALIPQSELAELRAELESHRWIPVTERLPSPEDAGFGAGWCLVTQDAAIRRVEHVQWDKIDREFPINRVLAWRYAPKAWKGDAK